MTTEKSFPYMLKRLKVVHREEVELSPIENASENIQNRSEQLLTEASANPPDLKALQNVLQGSILLRKPSTLEYFCF